MKTKNQELLEKFNEAFARNDTDFVINHVTDSIKWSVVGDFKVEGKEAFTKALKKMKGDEPLELEIDKVITHGKDASVNGIMKSKNGVQYAFCDVYTFSGFKNPKIREMTSYVIEVKSENSSS
ncbi:nuclear transport factor 2 family protein [Rhodohalobacter sp. SW132]|uniref:nuclear transport factor 2 family protein n=1 Tax=Rhodohalobacter sp. SW132 TaxID=2293433 RepID=UPI0018F35AAC|nr:nuclear transport factor 2 family protein [Rhodohalobacter sp. SW132]